MIITEKIYIVTDLGPGDGGKGSVVHKIATMLKTHTIVKVGGAQGSHGVRTSAGEKFAFSQWGCGTFDGVRTHLSPRMVISPEGLLNEADALINEWRIANAFDLLTVDQEALCATPFHGIASRIKEMALGGNNRGTIGTGVGETYRYSQQFPNLAIRAKDLLRPDIRNLIIATCDKVRTELEPIIQEKKFLHQDYVIVEEEINRLYDDHFIDYVVSRFHKAGKLMNIVGSDYLEKSILPKKGAIIVESSHGVLTDCYNGFHPHTSAIRTLPCFTQSMLREAGYEGVIVNIGVFRSYAIRHGVGAMPTNDSSIIEGILPDSYKEENRWQGKVRVGPIDLVLLRYAIDVCGGPKSFDGLAVTWFDQVMKIGEWRLCDCYTGIDDRTYFTSSGAIKVRNGIDEEQLRYQENLNRQLLNCHPEIMTLKIPLSKKDDEIFSFCAEVLEGKLGVPVKMISFGPTEREKICR